MVPGEFPLTASNYLPLNPDMLSVKSPLTLVYKYLQERGKEMTKADNPALTFDYYSFETSTAGTVLPYKLPRVQLS